MDVDALPLTGCLPDMTYTTTPSLRLPRRRGFTLVEILVVVALIALLISLLLPSLNKSRRAANVARCQIVMRQCADANRNYAMDYLNRYVYNTYGGATHNGVTFTKYWSTDPIFLEYVGLSTETVSNRWKSNPGQYGGGFSAGCQWPDRFDCPEQGRPKYWMQNDHWGHEIGVSYNREQHSKSYGTTSIANPSMKFQFADGDNWWMNSRFSDYKIFFETGAIDHGGWGGMLPRHDTGNGEFANIAFYDNHVAATPKEEIFFYAAGPNGETANERNRAHWYLPD